MSEFSNNKAEVGGAIYFNNVENATFTSNYISQNQAINNTFEGGMGGGLYFTCDTT